MNGANFDKHGAMAASVDPAVVSPSSVLQAIAFDVDGSVIMVTTVPAGLTVCGGIPLGRDSSVYAVYKSNAGTKFTYCKGYKFSDLKGGAVVITQTSSATPPLVSKGRATFDATGALLIRPIL